MTHSAGGWAKGVLRDRVGLWPLLELRNRLALGPRAVAWRRWERHEVDRLQPQVHRGRVQVVTVIPTYRRPDQLPYAVASALGQTVTDHLVVVVDDGAGVCALPPDPRLAVVSLQRNSGVLGLVRNVGIRLTDSAYIAFLDDDNEWSANHLEVSLSALRDGPGMVYTAVERRTAEGRLIDTLSTPFDRHLLADGSCYIDANSVVIRRDAGVLFSRLPRVPATMPKEDWEFVYRMSRTRTVRHVPTPTVRYLVNADSYFTRWNGDALDDVAPT